MSTEIGEVQYYHKALWSKKLPNGEFFALDDTKDNAYLYHHSASGELFLSSDSAIPTFTKWKSMLHITSMLAEGEAEAFARASYTMGGMIIFPANRVDGKNTINGARGFHPLIKDRIDLTLECIRRFYNNEESPLTDVLSRYAYFFDLFRDFQGYVEFFLLQDLVTENFSEIKFLMPFADFKTPAVPKTIDDYLLYKNLTVKFIYDRNLRISENATRAIV